MEVLLQHNQISQSEVPSETALHDIYIQSGLGLLALVHQIFSSYNISHKIYTCCCYVIYCFYV